MYSSSPLQDPDVPYRSSNFSLQLSQIRIALSHDIHHASNPVTRISPLSVDDARNETQVRTFSGRDTATSFLGILNYVSDHPIDHVSGVQAALI